MALAIGSFSNASGSGPVFFKAAGHPLCLEAARNIVAEIKSAKRAALFDPQNTFAAFASLHGLAREDFAAIYAQNVEVLLSAAKGAEENILPLTALSEESADILFMPVFGGETAAAQIGRIVPAGCKILTLDGMRLPDRFLADARRYLNPVNFATNMLFFRDEDGAHTRLVTANYWGAYGAKEPFIWGRLFDGGGRVLADFEKPLGAPNETVIIDSAEIRKEFNLPEFCGQIFLHVARAAGHDIVKYVADSYGDAAAGKASSELSCTHDANSWPADLYAGIPAPEDGDKVLLWVQNSHPAPIPAGGVGANIMGDENAKYYGEEIPPFGTRAVDMGALLPEARWPAQIEIRAGRHFVRPRYEVHNRAGRRRINHANVERTDLQTDENIPRLAQWLDKGYILPAPILPRADFTSECLPTPMSTAQQNLPLAATVYNGGGKEIARRFLGCLPRRHQCLLNLSELAKELGANDFGHVELSYDFSEGGGGDGWMHALFRYTENGAGHAAETSFGAHMFNRLLTYKNEPQSYKGPPPGLTTRLFLRFAPPPAKTMCHLIYPAGEQWNAPSDTRLELKNRRGEAVAEYTARIAAGGSFLFYCEDIFDGGALAKAGADGYIIVRDTTCRLFGYHGARAGDAFAFDHMFGF